MELQRKTSNLFLKDLVKQNKNTPLLLEQGLDCQLLKSFLNYWAVKYGLYQKLEKEQHFYFTIPLIFQKQPKITTTSKAQFNNIKINVLIAEDNLPNFLYLKSLFSKYNYQILHALNGAEALKLFNKNKTIDLILMDLKMPVMDGLETTREIRKTDKNIPIIALTAFAMENDREKAIEAGCNDYISKPVSNEKLIEIIHKNIKQK